MLFSEKIIKWFKKNKRDLPWRNTKDPYKIWLSEVILQQTRVEQGKPYYFKFTEKYKSVNELADADIDEVLKTWQGLGYYSRARNLHTTAKIISEKYSGKFPETYSELLKLKGVGEYTAAAISSIVYNEPKAVVDGNVYRVLSRIFGIKNAINSSAGKKIFAELTNELLDKKNAGIYNQAIMEFGALYCTPKKPDCGNCIYNLECIARKKKLVEVLPVKEKKAEVKTRYLNYFFIISNKKTFLQQRKSNDIWKGLFEFPLIETDRIFSLNEISEHEEFKKIFTKKNIEFIDEKTIIHKLTHRNIIATFRRVNYPTKKNNLHNEIFEVDLKQIHTFAVSRLTEKYLETQF